MTEHERELLHRADDLHQVAAGKIRRSARAEWLAKAAAVVVALALLGLSTWQTAQVRGLAHRGIEQSQANTRILAQSQRNGAIIRSCVTPGGDCYKQGQASTTKILADVARLIEVAVTCADAPGVQTRAQVVACVTDGLTAGPKH